MQPDPVRVEETAGWVKKSRKDLWRAEGALTLDPPDTEDCLFHCQQAAEKSLKAFLVATLNGNGFFNIRRLCQVNLRIFV